jgi:hypothetical protein
MYNKYFIIDRQREDNLQPSTAIPAPDCPICAARRLTVTAGPNYLLAFRDAHAMLGCVFQIPGDPAEILAFVHKIIHT